MYMYKIKCIKLKLKYIHIVGHQLGLISARISDSVLTLLELMYHHKLKLHQKGH